MTGSEITPMAMTDAATVPVMAPRMAPTITTAKARPPGILPKSWPVPSRRSSARPQRSRIAPMKVKNGIASSSSLETMPKKRKGNACRKFGSKCWVAMPSMPKKRPTAASENATGKPISKNRIMPPNIRGGMTPCENISASVPGSLQRLFVVRVEPHLALEGGDALDQLGDALQPEQREAERQRQLDGPENQPASVVGDLADLEGAHEEWGAQIREIQARRNQEDDKADGVDPQPRPVGDGRVDEIDAHVPVLPQGVGRPEEDEGAEQVPLDLQQAVRTVAEEITGGGVAG